MTRVRGDTNSTVGSLDEAPRKKYYWNILDDFVSVGCRIITRASLMTLPSSGIAKRKCLFCVSSGYIRIRQAGIICSS